MQRQRGSSIQRVVLKNGDTRWRFRLDLPPGPDGKRRQQTITCRTEAEAIERQARSRTQVAAREYVEPDQRTINDVLDAWLSSRSLHWRPGTAYTNRIAVNVWRDTIGTIRVQRLTREDVERAARYLLTTGGSQNRGRSPRTVRTALMMLKSALTQAVIDGVITRNVAEHVRLPRAEEHERAVWTADQIAAFLAAADDHPLVGLFHLLALGMRRGEVLGVRWSDIDEHARVVHVRQTRTMVGSEVVTGPPKSARGRRDVPLSADALRALRLTRERTLGNVTPMPRSLTLVTDVKPDALSREFRRIARAAGVPMIRPHDLRHSVATLLVERGVPIVTVASLLGHDPAMTMRVYSHVGDTSRQNAVDMLSAALAR